MLAPSFVVSSALEEADVDRTVDVVGQACAVYRKALDAGDPTPWLGAGRCGRCSGGRCEVRAWGARSSDRRPTLPRPAARHLTWVRRASATRSITQAAAGTTASAVQQPPTVSVG